MQYAVRHSREPWFEAATGLPDAGAGACLWADLDEELAARMRERLRGAVDMDWDKVHVFELCGACEGRMFVSARGELVHDPV